MLKGSCCCNAVQFQVDEQPGMMATCHCSRCRKVGAATFVFVNRSAFKLVQGEDAISVYEPEEGRLYRRSFCGRCGTALGEITSDADSFPVPANCFDDPLNLEIRFHEFVAEKPAWLKICDDAKQFEHHPVKS
jgi:hypothetical protein